jgi:hypothetical protein
VVPPSVRVIRIGRAGFRVPYSGELVLRGEKRRLELSRSREPRPVTVGASAVA